MSDALPPPPAPDLRIRRFRGPGVSLVRHTWRASMSEEAWEAILQDQDAAIRAFLQFPPPPETWVETEFFLRVAEIFLHGKGAAMIQLQGAMTAESMAVVPGLLHVRTLAELIDRFAELWPHYFQGGVATGRWMAPNHAEIRILADFPGEWLFLFLRGWILQLARSFGHASVKVRYDGPTPEAPYLHRYEVAWEELRGEVPVH